MNRNLKAISRKIIGMVNKFAKTTKIIATSSIWGFGQEPEMVESACKGMRKILNEE